MKYLAILFLTIAGSVNAASFNCDKAVTLVEKSICSNNNLSKLDAALSANYTGMMGSDIGDIAKNNLRATQRDWLTTRNTCTTVQCIEILYRQRIDAVCEYPVISGVHPVCINSNDFLSATEAQPHNQVQQQPKFLSQGSVAAQSVQQEELQSDQITSHAIDELSSEEISFKAWQASQAKELDTPTQSMPVEIPQPQPQPQPTVISAKSPKTESPRDDFGFFTILFTVIIGLPLAYPIWKIIIWMDQYMISRAERYHRPAAQIILPQIGGSLAIGLFIAFVIVNAVKFGWHSLFK